MGRIITPTTYRKAETPQELMGRFALLMRQRYGATLYLFGSRARNAAGPFSDYDIVAVSEAFRENRPADRVEDRSLLWYEAGGWGQALDLHCYTPEEFSRQIEGGMGYLGQAERRGELVEIPLRSEPADSSSG